MEYDAGHPAWASGTSIAGSDFGALAGGNFVIYASGHVAVWATGTNRSGSVLTIQDDRRIVIYAPAT